MPLKLLIGCRVIICEDEAMPTIAFSRAIAFMGCTDVHAVRTGEEAVKSAKAKRPDLVLMDVILPGINGIEATRQIKARMNTCVVVISGHAQGEEAGSEALDAGADGYLAKPVTKDDIISLIQSFGIFPKQPAAVD